MAQGETPKASRQAKDNRRGNDQLEHQPARLTERLDEKSRRDVSHDHHGNNPAKYHPEKSGKNYVGITRDVEEIKVTINETLRAHDPEADCRKTEHNGVMNRDTEAQRGHIKQHRHRIWDDTEL